MSENALHHDLVLNFSQKVVGDVRIENFLDCDRSSIQQPFVNNREATLANLFADLAVINGNFTNARYDW